MKTKYIFVTGGVLSGLGKGVTAASIGNILQARGFKIWLQKFDQYLNVDAGTLNPHEHGEVFVLDDGSETDLDLGHYERFLNISLNKTSSVMSGQIYQAVLEKERSGKFLGKTIQMIPHVTDEVKARLFEAAQKSKADILITEIGGTIGDYEGTHFIEAIRQMQYDAGKVNVLYIHVGFLPFLGASEELKSKPLQNSVHDLQAMGIQPDIIIARADHPVEEKIINKIALFTGVEKTAVIPLETVSSIYLVPLVLEKFKIAQIIGEKLKLKLKKSPNHQNWQEFCQKIKAVNLRQKTINIGLVGKYMEMKDTYLSVTEALKIAATAQGVRLSLGWIEAESIEKQGPLILKKYQGLVVPGGFGSRGTEGKILAIKYAREKKIPFFGLCFGMQLTTIEFARNVAGLKRACSKEIEPKTSQPVIHIMPEQEKKMLENDYGGSMRLGAYPCLLSKDTLAYKAYKKWKNEKSSSRISNSSSHISNFESTILERHRHRFEFNNAYREILEKKGLVISGTSPDGRLVEIIELSPKIHPFFVATQFHPEFKCRPLSPHPLFSEFIRAAGK